MKRAFTILAVTFAVIGAAPALAGGGKHNGGGSSSSSGGSWGGHGSSGSSSSTGGYSSSSGSGPTDVPEPSDAALVLMGAATLFLGRKLQARRAAKRG
jgi:MYXO-CTERM domain-containing protein